MTSAPQDAGTGLWEALIALGTLILSLMGSAVAGTWVLGNSRNKVNEKIDKAVLELESKIDDENDTVKAQFGETVTALREKIRETELWNRDNFVSKQTFTLVMQEMRTSWQRFEDKLDKRLDTIEAKIAGKIPPWGGK